MPETTATTWRCSRCDGERIVSGTEQPQRWARLFFARPPRSGAPNDIVKLGDLCPDCVDAVYAFMADAPALSELAPAGEEGKQP